VPAQRPTRSVASADAPPLTPGVSEALARWRALRVREVRYDLVLDLTRHARDTVAGRVTVRFVRAGGGDAVLDFRGPRLGGATVNGRAAPGVRAERGHVRVPAALLRDGENAIALDFAALVAPAGASVIRYRDATDGAEYLYTLLVPNDAPALFPCFDQPDLKARVTLALRVPDGWTALANGAATDSSASAPSDAPGPTDPPGAPGARTFRFAETRPISTYLIAFAAGPWQTVTRTVAGRPITLHARRSRMAEVEADSILEQNGRALAYLETWFAQPYPFDKYDVLLAPAFPFGGMEHPGAVFYNEETFVFRERPTLTQRLARAATIYHEVAHQWFGDLVTMRWFDDLWLKEGSRPTWRRACRGRSTRARARRPRRGRRSTCATSPRRSPSTRPPGTTPVWQALAHLDQAKSNYGAIVYNKAPGIIKQLEYAVGERAFQAGLREFLARHAYGNATWQDLLASVGRAADRDLAAWGAQYILRPGVPVLEAERHAGAVVVRQRPAHPEVSGAGAWPVRGELLVWATRRGARCGARSSWDEVSVVAAGWASATRRRCSGSQTRADPATRSSPLRREARAGRAGWAGTVGDPCCARQLGRALWNLAREARFAPRASRAGEHELPAEQDERSRPFAGSACGRRPRVVGPQQGATRSYPGWSAGSRARPTTRRAPTAPQGAPRRARRRGATPGALAALDARLDSATAAGAPLGAPTRWAIVTALVARDAPTAERRLAEETRRDSTSEGRRRAFVAGAAHPDPAVKAAYFARYFADRALNEEWVTASLAAFVAPGHEALARPYLAPALDSLAWVQRNRRIFFLGSWLDAMVASQTEAGALREVEGFLARHPTLPADLRRKVLQAADELRRTVAVREAWAR
jgi:aminopeptidase N